MAKTKPVKGASSKVEREKLGIILRETINAGLWQKGSLDERWQAVEAFYRNQPPKWSNRLLPGCEMMHFPLLQPKIDRLAGTTVRTLTDPSPMLLAQLRGVGQRVEQMEDTFEFFHEIGGLDSRLRMLGTISGCTDCGVLKVVFEAVAEDALSLHPEHVVTMPGMLSYVGFRYDVIHPVDFVLYPSTPYGISAAKLVGNRFWQRVADIEEKQKDGRYFEDVDIKGGDTPQKYEAGRDFSFSLTSYATAPDSRDLLVECFEVIFKYKMPGDERERRYKAVLEFTHGIILSIEAFPYRLPWYREFRFKDLEYGGFWPSRSVGNDLQGLQAAYNHIQNLLVYGSYHAAFPAVIGDLPEKAKKYGPGDVIPGNGAEVAVIRNDFNPGQLAMMVQQIERQADAVARFSQMATGQQLTTGTTATEANALLSGQADNDNDYLLNFGSSLPDICEIEKEQLFHNFAVAKSLYADQMAIDDRTLLGMPTRWTIQGKNPNSTPDVHLQKFMALIQMCQEDPQIAQMIDLAEVVQSYVNAMELPNGSKILVDQSQGQPVTNSGPAAGLSSAELYDLVPQLMEYARQANSGGAPPQAPDQPPGPMPMLGTG